MFQVAWLRQPALAASSSNHLALPLSLFLCAAVPKSHSEHLLTVFSKIKFPSQMNFWNHVYSMTIGTFFTSSSPFLPLTLEQPHHYSLHSKQPFSLDLWFVPFYYLDLSLPGMDRLPWPATVVSFPQAAMQRSFRSLTMIPLSPGRVWSSRWLWLLLCYKPLAAAAAFHPALSCFPTPACVGADSQTHIFPEWAQGAGSSPGQFALPETLFFQGFR